MRKITSLLLALGFLFVLLCNTAVRAAEPEQSTEPHTAVSADVPCDEHAAGSADADWLKPINRLLASLLGAGGTVTLTNAHLPSGRLVLGHSFPLEGTLSSANPMTRITATISTDSGIPELTNTVTLNRQTTYSLKNSPIDRSMVFGRLPVGAHVLLIQIAEDVSSSGQSGEERITELCCPFTVYQVPQSRTIAARGIDVSCYQGNIDWATAATAIDFAIIRCGYGSDFPNQDDSAWRRNADACTQLGIPFGVYLYSYALTDAQAQSEAQHVIRLLEGYTPTLPVYLDLENAKTVGTLSCADLLRHTEIFCNAIEAAGYTPGVYASASWWAGKLASGAYDRWSRWVAKYSGSLNYFGELDVWQYSDSGSVPGIKGNVDCNLWYGTFPPDEAPAAPSGPFADVPDGAFYADAVLWAYSHSPQIVSGTNADHFSPSLPCTRAQVLTCLWNAMHTPEADWASSLFVDVPEEKYFFKPVLWATQNGITGGADPTHFNPKGSCTRAQVVTFLWAASGKPEPTDTEHLFEDVQENKYYCKAVRWAAAEGITGGTDPTHFSPNKPCTRAEVVTFLYKLLAAESVPNE